MIQKYEKINQKPPIFNRLDYVQYNNQKIDIYLSVVSIQYLYMSTSLHASRMNKSDLESNIREKVKTEYGYDVRFVYTYGHGNYIGQSSESYVTLRILFT